MHHPARPPGGARSPVTPIHIVAIAFAAGAVIGAVAVAIMLNAAHRRRLAEQIAEQVERARAAEREARSVERLAELGSMTAGLAHEIKNPLSTIGLNAQLLREAVADLAGDESERARLTRRVDGLRREAERLTGILSDFLEYAGELKLEPVETDLNTLVEELADFYSPQAEQNGVRVRIELHPEPVRASTDAPHLKQALLNLMINAVQAMSGRGPDGHRNELIVRVSAEPTPSVHIIDTGPGISAEALERIFHPYFSTKAGGTGLGLPTTRRIIEAHGGTIDVHSEPGTGTDFTIRLPGPTTPARP
jgi:signal transduction histidine kinase